MANTKKRGLSGLTIRSFAKKHGLAEYQFYAWRRELRLRDREAAEAKGSRTGTSRRSDKVIKRRFEAVSDMMIDQESVQLDRLIWQ